MTTFYYNSLRIQLTGKRNKESRICTSEKFITVLTTLCMIGLELLELLCSFLSAFLVFVCAKIYG